MDMKYTFAKKREVCIINVAITEFKAVVTSPFIDCAIYPRKLFILPPFSFFFALLKCKGDRKSTYEFKKSEFFALDNIAMIANLDFPFNIFLQVILAQRRFLKSIPVAHRSDVYHSSTGGTS